MGSALRPGKLTVEFVEEVERPGRYSDGRGANGLSLLVRETTDGRIAKTWSQRVTIDRQRTNLGLGPYPVVTLAEARDAALENRRAVHRGYDPRQRKSPARTPTRRAWGQRQR
ncbi:Arm DNA-binding domain-containing protein [Candidatus Poriferisocius sp.]|uniref:Arm DNA-binding domain-containing protein n=1 Tax=Candidatus Poriferisocius sp. TaxID=3101276 RepID=UPI003B01F6EC